MDQSAQHQLDKKLEWISKINNPSDKIQHFLKEVPYHYTDQNLIKQYITQFMELAKLIPEKDHQQFIQMLTQQELVNLLEYINKAMEFVSNGIVESKNQCSSMFSLNLMVHQEYGSSIHLQRINSRKSLTPKLKDEQ